MGPYNICSSVSELFLAGGAGAVSKVHPCNKKHHSTFKAEGYSTAHVQSSLGDEPMSW